MTDTQPRLPILRIDRYMDILAQHGMRPFEREPWVNPRTGMVEPRVLGERPPMRWRVSPDEWYRLEAIVMDRYGWHAVGVDNSMLYGWPIESDATLPPNSVVFERAADTMEGAMG